MKTTITKSFFVDQPKEKVWEYLSHPDRLVPCLPGATLLEIVDEQNFKGEVTMKFGPVKAKYNGDIEILEIDKSNWKMVMSGKGLDSKGKGSADMLMNGTLVEKDGGTETTFSMEITIIGMLAQFGARLINDVTDQVLNTFIENFRKELVGQEVDNTLNASSMAASVMKSKIGSFFGGGKKEETPPPAAASAPAPEPPKPETEREKMIREIKAELKEEIKRELKAELLAELKG